MMATTRPPIILGTSERAPPPPRGSDGRGRPRAVAAGGGRRWPGVWRGPGGACVAAVVAGGVAAAFRLRVSPSSALPAALVWRGRAAAAGRGGLLAASRSSGSRSRRAGGRPGGKGGLAGGCHHHAGRWRGGPARALADGKAPPCSQPRRGRAGAPGRVPVGRRTPPDPLCSCFGGTYGLATAVGMAACVCRLSGLPLAPPPPTRRRSRLYREEVIHPSSYISGLWAVGLGGGYSEFGDASGAGVRAAERAGRPLRGRGRARCACGGGNGSGVRAGGAGGLRAVASAPSGPPSRRRHAEDEEGCSPRRRRPCR